MSIAYVHDETQPLKTSAPDFGWRSASIGCGRTPSAGVLQGTASQRCRKVFESDVRRSLKPHPFNAQSSILRFFRKLFQRRVQCSRISESFISRGNRKDIPDSQRACTTAASLHRQLSHPCECDLPGNPQHVERLQILLQRRSAKLGRAQADIEQ